MKRSAKIGCLVAGVLIFAAAALLTTGVSYLWRFEMGSQAAELGYDEMRRADYAAASVVFTDALSKPLTHSDRYWVHLNRGAAETFGKQYDAAIGDFTAAMAIDPSMGEPYERRGWVYEQRKEPDKAIADYTRAIERDPNRGTSHYRRATILYDRGELQKALPDFDEAIRTQPNRAEQFLMRGLCHLKLNDLDHALASLDAALSIDPRSRRGYEERARVYRLRGESERALFDAAKANYLRSALRPQSSPLPSPLPKPGLTGQLDVQPLPKFSAKPAALVSVEFTEIIDDAAKAADDGELRKAIDFYNKALGLEINPIEASYAMRERGTCFWNEGEYDKARDDYEEAIRLNPRNARNYVDRAIDLDGRGDIDGALRDYEAAMRLDPGEYFAYCYRGLALFHQGDLKDALVDFAKSIQVNPGKPEAYIYRAALYIEQSNPAEAVADCSTAINFHPESFRAHGQRARAYVRLGNCDMAETDIQIEKSLSHHDSFSVHDSVAWFRATCPDARLRNGKEALSEARRACELTHWNSWRPMETLAAAEAETGDFGKAVEYENRALRLPVPPVLRPEAEDRLKLYQQRRPFRETAVKAALSPNEYRSRETPAAPNHPESLRAVAGLASHFGL
jgi:tetratricopeptide (TPR) repeat protein